MGLMGAMGHSVCALRPFQGILENVSSCSMKASSVINCYFLLGGEQPPSPLLCLRLHYSVFSLCHVQKTLDVSSPVSLLTPQACKAPSVLGIQESVRGMNGGQVTL